MPEWFYLVAFFVAALGGWRLRYALAAENARALSDRPARRAKGLQAEPMQASNSLRAEADGRRVYHLRAWWFKASDL
jgi:hypothetical protein